MQVTTAVDVRDGRCLLRVCAKSHKGHANRHSSGREYHVTSVFVTLPHLFLCPLLSLWRVSPFALPGARRYPEGHDSSNEEKAYLHLLRIERVPLPTLLLVARDSQDSKCGEGKRTAEPCEIVFVHTYPRNVCHLCISRLHFYRHMCFKFHFLRELSRLSRAPCALSTGRLGQRSTD